MHKKIAPILAFLATLFTLACSRPAKNEATAPTITVSIYPQKYFIDRISGNFYKVNVMIPKTIGHSDYSPTAGQMKELAHSEAYLAIGSLDFEITWAERLRSVSPDLKWIDLSQNFPLLSGHVCSGDHDHHHVNQSYDPHYWMSPSGAKHLATRIQQQLDKLHPERSQITAQNMALLMNEIEQLHNLFSKLKDRNITFIIYHPALAYLARDYGFTQMVIEEDGKTPTPAGLKNLIDRARKAQVKKVFIQKNFDENNARVAADAIGAEIISINPENEEWLEEMTNLAKHLSAAQ